MNHIYIGLGDVAKHALGDFYQHYKNSTVDKSEALHAEFMTVTDAVQSGLYLFDGLSENEVEVNYQIQSISVDAPTIRNALLFLRDHRWLKMDTEEQSYWTELIDDGVEDIAHLPRRIIRLNLASAVEKLLNHIHSAYLRLQSQYDDEGLALHLVVDLSNDWVKAILTDVVVQLRQHYPSLFCRLGVYLLLPPNFSVTKLDALQSTSLYATLVEFNALLNNHWMPENLLNILPLSEDGNWVNMCYMVEQDSEKKEVSGLSALLLRKAFVSDADWLGAFADEYAYYENEKRVKKPNFFSFGIFRLATTVDYPTEYYKKLFTVQVLNALLFSNWQEKTGYIADDNYDTRQQFVSQLDNMMEDWCLDMDYLTLNKLMTHDQSKLHPKWASVATEWERNREERLQSLDGVPNAEKAEILVQRYVDFYENRFRLKGVENFYETEWTESRLDALAFKIVSGIEKYLIGQWWNYDRGLADLPAMILSVLDYLSNQSDVLEDQCLDYQQKEREYTLRYQEHLQSKQESRGKFRLFGSAGDLSGLDQDLYETFTAKTHVSALLFAQRLLLRLNSKLGQLHEQISDIFHHLVSVRDRYAKILQQIDQISAKGTWVSNQEDVHMQQVSLNVYLEIDKMREQIFAQPFEIKNFVKRFKGQLRDQFSQHTNFSVFNEHLGQKEFGISIEKISDNYAEHLDFLLSGKNKRPETSELITSAVNLTSEAKLDQFIQFLDKMVTAPKSKSYVPTTSGKPKHLFQTRAQLFAPTWVNSTHTQPVLNQLLKPNMLEKNAIKLTKNLSNYVDLVNVHQVNLKNWSAISHLSNMYNESLGEYEDIKRAFFQWHAEHRMIGWLEHALIDPEYSLEEMRYVLIKAQALGLIAIEFKGFKVQVRQLESKQILTGGMVVVDRLLESIKPAEFVVLERILQTSEAVNNLNVSFQVKLEKFLHQLKQSFFALDEEDDKEDDGDWAVAGMFVAWQRTTQKVLNELG